MNTENQTDAPKPQKGFSRSRFVIVSVVILATGVAVIIFVMSALQEQPEYDGKSLDYWCDRLVTDYPTNEAAVRALLAIGTNAIPYLVKDLRHTDGAFNSLQRANEILSGQDVVQARFRTVHKWQRGTWGLMALGPLASNAIAELESMLPERPQAIQGLIAIGDPAVGALLRTQTNYQFWADNHLAASISSVASFGRLSKENFALFVPTLRVLAQNSNHLTASEAGWALKNFSNMILQATEAGGLNTAVTNDGNP